VVPGGFVLPGGRPVVNSTLLLILLPLLLVIVVIGVVLIVALCQARPEDVPDLVRDATRLFGWVVKRLPHRPGGLPAPRDDETHDEDEEVAP
jgi:hypothetical protein